MMLQQPIQHTIRRYMSLKTHRITAMPVVILMPHSACNCRCVMCDIWKGNRNLKQLTEKDIVELLVSLKKLQTRQVVMSGGEALLHPGFFRLCALLKQQGLDITLLSTGLGLARNAALVLEHIDALIVSLDGDQHTHDAIRNIPGAFDKLHEGVEAIKKLRPGYPVRARTVIHRLNFRVWPEIIEAAKELGLDQVSFLPADVSSSAFNRQERWSEERVEEVALGEDELPELRSVIDRLWSRHRQDFETRFIAESPAKINGIYLHYSALHGLNDFPVKKCNAPWVSAVVEPDGSVRPCFFHDAIGNIREASLHDIVNGPQGMEFRRGLDMETNPVCRQCVCSLNLRPWVNPAT
jgi:MoaA/NifB/PqqE/SkfB family radical SAM enzyme